MLTAYLEIDKKIEFNVFNVDVWKNMHAVG